LRSIRPFEWLNKLPNYPKDELLPAIYDEGHGKTTSNLLLSIVKDPDIVPSFVIFVAHKYS